MRAHVRLGEQLEPQRYFVTRRNADRMRERAQDWNAIDGVCSMARYVYSPYVFHQIARIRAERIRSIRSAVTA